MTYTERVEYHMLRAGLYWSNRYECAKAVNLSPSSMSRHLALEGTTFQEIRTKVRKIIAEHPPCDFRDFTFAMGFTHPQALHRWFKSQGLSTANRPLGRPPQLSCPQSRT